MEKKNAFKVSQHSNTKDLCWMNADNCPRWVYTHNAEVLLEANISFGGGGN